MRHALAAALLIAASPAAAEEIGRIGTDWTDNDVVVEAIADPAVQGVTCHITYFERGLIDRLWQGNWFEDPSNTSISCGRTGPIVIGDIETDENGEEIFSQRQSLVFKSIAVRRIWDGAHDVLVYVSFSRQIQEGSAKMAISTVPLRGEDVTWAEGRPE
jgi:CreA protein